jgi:hypothetical protein
MNFTTALKWLRESGLKFNIAKIELALIVSSLQREINQDQDGRNWNRVENCNESSWNGV